MATTPRITELPASVAPSRPASPLPSVSDAPGPRDNQSPTNGRFARVAQSPNNMVSLAVLGVGSALGGAALATRLCLPQHPTKLLISSVAGAAFTTRLGHALRGADPVPSSDVSWLQVANVAGAFAFTGAALAGAARLVFRLTPAQALRSALAGAAIGVVPLLLGTHASPVHHSALVRTLGHYAGHAAAWESALRLPDAVATFSALALFPASGAVAFAAAGLGLAHAGAKVVSHLGRRNDDNDAPELAALQLQMPLARAAVVGMFVGCLWGR